MAELGRRDVVGDPLALNPAAQAADRSLSTMGVRNPGQSGGQNEQYQSDMGLVQALGQFGDALTGVVKAKEDDWTTEGQLMYMQGATEEQIAATGNKWTMQGWQSLNAVDQANRWYANELSSIENGGRTMDPTEYGKLLMEKRAQFMQDLPEDPAIRKLYIAAFGDLGPRLTAQQTAAHNEWNKEQTSIAFGSALSSGSYTNSDAPRVVPGGAPVPLSPGVVRSTVSYTAGDVDALTRVMLGEAAGEGPQGLAAVAHVALNRVIDGRYGNGWGSVLRPDQFNGAVNGAKYDPNSIAYTQARNIAMEVLSGHSVDPTNGRTHFVSGGIRPDWWESERAKGDVIRINGHEFVGQARNLGTHSASGTSGNLIFAHEDQKDLTPQFASVLSATGRQLGIDIKINSGHRSEDHPVEAGKANPGEHTRGHAADIDMTGMNDEERANLVRTLQQNGATRFITYSNTNHLHVDMAPAPSGSGNWFMHDSSNQNMASAPAWFKAVSQEPIPAGGTNVLAYGDTSALDAANGLGIPTAQSISIAQTQAQDFIRNFNMPADQKAAATAQEMVTQLGMGSSQLWDSVGGVGFLQELGATPQQIRLVQNAKDQYDQDQLNKFSMERSQWAAGLTLKVESGELTADEAYAEIQERYDADQISDQAANSLVNAVMQEAAQGGKTDVTDPAFNRAVATIYQRLKDPNMYTAEEAQAELQMLAGQYNVPPAQLEQLIGTVWTREEQARDQLATDVAAAERKAAERQVKVDEVTRAMANGQGLKGVTGTIDGMPAQQWGIEKRFAELQAAGKEAIPGYMEGGLTQQEAILKANSVAEDILWKELLGQGGVVQQGLADSMTASLSGLAASTKFTMNDDIANTFDTYLRLKEVDPTGTYASGYLQTDAARSLMLNAERFYTGGFALEDAMEKAHEFLRNGITVDSAPNITQTSGFARSLSTHIQDNFDSLMGSPEWLSSSGVTAADKNWAMANMDQLRQAVTARAWTYYADQPQNDPDVLIKMATQDVLRNSAIVGGNIMTPRDAGGVPIATQMGLEGYGQDAPNKAIAAWLKKYADGEAAALAAGGDDATGWGAAWNARQPNLAERGVSLMGRPSGSTMFTGEDEKYMTEPPFYASWNEDAGALTVTLWETDERKATVPYDTLAPLQLDLAEIGEWYRKETEAQGANGFQNMWGQLFGGQAK